MVRWKTVQLSPRCSGGKRAVLSFPVIGPSVVSQAITNQSASLQWTWSWSCLNMREQLLTLLLTAQLCAVSGMDSKSFWSYNGLALSEVPWNSVTDRYVMSNFSWSEDQTIMQEDSCFHFIQSDFLCLGTNRLVARHHCLPPTSTFHHSK